MANASPAAQRLLDACQDNKTSVSALFLLRLGRNTLAGSEIGAALLQLCESLGVALPLPERFFHDVKRRRDSAQQPIATSSSEWARTSSAVPSRWNAKSANSRAKAPASAKCGARRGSSEG